MPGNNIITSLLFPLLFVFLWSTGFIGAKYGMPYVEPFTFLFLRMAIVACLMIFFAYLASARWPQRPIDFAHAAVVGVIIHGVYLGGVFFAISKGLDAGISALIVSLQPLLTVVLSVTFLGEKTNIVKNSGIALGLIGVIMVILPRGVGADGITSLTLTTCVISLIAISAGTIYQKRFCNEMELLPAACIQYIAVSLFLLPIAFTFETMELQWSLSLAFALAWLVLALSCGAVVLLMWLLQRGDAGKVASLFYLVPPFTAVEAWLLFDETLGPIAIIGMVVCVLGVALVMRKKQPARQ